MVQLNSDHMDNTVGSRQRDIIVGTLLGDGFIERNGKGLRLVMDHSAVQKEYVRWKAHFLSGMTYSILLKDRYDSRTGKVYRHCILRTRNTPRLYLYLDAFYASGTRKSIPLNLPDMMTPQMLAVWIMDDGYRRNDCNALRINSQSYVFEEHAIIQKSLKRLDIPSSIQKHKAAFVTYIPSRGMHRLRQLIEPLVIPQMKYKIA